MLFIDARKMGVMVDRARLELTDEDTKRISDVYHAWRGEKTAGKYLDEAGFCMSMKLEEIAKHGYVLTPGRYVGAEDVEDTDEDFATRMLLLTGNLSAQIAEGERLDAEISLKLKGLGYGL